MARERIKPAAMGLVVAACWAMLAANALGALPKELAFEPLEFTPPSPEHVTLPNGIRLFLLEDHELPVFDISAMIRTGDVFDPPGKEGLASLTATVLRTGGTESRTPDELNETLEFIAGSVGSSIEDDAARASLSVMASDIELGIELFADVLLHPAFREDKLELARNQALEGIRRQNDNPNQVASRRLYRLIYGSHPYGSQPTEKSIQSITRDDLVEFHRKHYRPENLWLAVSGDFRRDAIIELLTQALGGWQSSGEAVAEPPQATDARNAGVYHIEKDLNQTSVLMGHLGITRTNPDVYAVTVMNYILGGGGFTSRLMREVRSNRGLAYYAQSVFRRRALRGIFLAGSSTKSETTVQAIELMRDLMASMREGDVSDEELDLARNSIVNSFIFAYTSNEQIVSQDMAVAYHGYPEDFLSAYTKRIQTVSVADVRRVAQQYLQPDALTIVTVGREGSFGRALSDIGPVTHVSLTDGE
ncbi:insulinase family protein [Candidatus Poribacteria bacterium]|nr:insulinase family protein [Candidatus Poribacteria bacterium]